MARTILIAAVMMVGGPLAVARADAPTPTAFVAAFDAGNEEEFTRLAQSIRGDPWIMADEILALARPGVARALARQATTPDAAALRTYLRHPAPEAPKTRAALQHARSLRAEGKPRDALAALEPHLVSAEGLLAPRMYILRSLLLLATAGPAPAAESFHETAALGRALGWLGIEEAALKGEIRGRAGTGTLLGQMDATERLIEVQRLRGKLGDVVGSDVALAQLHERLGRPDLALVPLRDAVSILRPLKAPGALASVADLVALMYAKLGQYAAAQDALDEAARLRKAVSAEPDAYTRVVRGAVLTEIGDRDRAEAELARAAELLEPGDLIGRADAAGQLGHLRLESGRFDDAGKDLARARKLYEQAGDIAGVQAALRMLARLQVRRDRPKEAIKLIETFLGTVGDDVYGRAYAELELGRAAIADGQPDRARQVLSSARDAARQLGIGDLESDATFELARLAAERGDPARAYALAFSALQGLDEFSSGLADQTLAEARATRRRYYQTAAAAAWALESPKRLHEVLDRWNAVSLMQALGGRGRLESIVLPPDLAAERGRAFEELAAARRALGESRARRLTLKARHALALRVREAKARVRETSERLQRIERRGRSLVAASHPSLDFLRSQFGTHDAYVAFTEISGRLHAVVATPKAARIVELDERARVETTSQDLARALSDGEGGMTALAAARAQLITALGLPAAVTRLVIVPEGRLAQLPWPALVNGRDVVCVQSASVWTTLDAPSADRTRPVLALGDPAYGKGRHAPALFVKGRQLPRLRASADEARAVANREHDVLRLRADATEQGLWEGLAGQPAWSCVHLACHGLLDTGNPSLSALALTPSGQDDGFLTALEIFGRSVPTDLVVLSACETGLGRVVGGEGVLGLTRAFLVAGASCVLVSLTKVDDEATAALMQAFHRAWREGHSAAQSLRAAQAAVRDHPSGRWREPRYWAAWALWGRAWGT